MGAPETSVLVPQDRSPMAHSNACLLVWPSMSSCLAPSSFPTISSFHFVVLFLSGVPFRTNRPSNTNALDTNPSFVFFSVFLVLISQFLFYWDVRDTENDAKCNCSPGLLRGFAEITNVWSLGVFSCPLRYLFAQQSLPNQHFGFFQSSSTKSTVYCLRTKQCHSGPLRTPAMPSSPR